MKGRTTFVIAHRLSTIKHANRIFVISAGKIVETGTYDELWKKQGCFADLLATQLEHLDDRKSGRKRSRADSRNSKDAIRGKTAADKGDNPQVATSPGVRQHDKHDSQSRSRDESGRHGHAGHDASHSRNEEVSEPRGRHKVHEAVQAIHRRLSHPAARASGRQESPNLNDEEDTLQNSPRTGAEIAKLDSLPKTPTSASSSLPKTLDGVGLNEPSKEEMRAETGPDITAERSKSMISLATSLQEHYKSQHLRTRLRSPKKGKKKDAEDSTSLPTLAEDDDDIGLGSARKTHTNSPAGSKESSPTRKIAKFLRTRSRRATAATVAGIESKETAVTTAAGADAPKAGDNEEVGRPDYMVDNAGEVGEAGAGATRRGKVLVDGTKDHGVDAQSLI